MYIILAYISEYNPITIAFTETWLSSNDIYTITMLSNFLTYYFIHSDKVYGRGGGVDVDIMIHNDFRIISSNFLVFSYSDRLSITLKSSYDIILKLLFTK